MHQRSRTLPISEASRSCGSWSRAIPRRCLCERTLLVRQGAQTTRSWQSSGDHAPQTTSSCGGVQSHPVGRRLRQGFGTWRHADGGGNMRGTEPDRGQRPLLRPVRAPIHASPPHVSFSAAAEAGGSCPARCQNTPWRRRETRRTAGSWSVRSPPVSASTSRAADGTTPSPQVSPRPHGLEKVGQPARRCWSSVGQRGFRNKQHDSYHAICPEYFMR